MIKQLYEKDEHYILEVLEKEEDIVFNNLINNIPDHLKFDLIKCIALNKEIEKLYAKL